VLLFAPLARAASLAGTHLQHALKEVLDATTVEDAREAYVAIRLARPGGLDRAESQDVSTDPTMTLLEVMRLAAHRDTIASEYATGFDVTFGTAVPALERARRDGLPWDDAVVETFLTLLAAIPDTHIARRSGPGLAADVMGRARQVLAAGGVRSEAGRRAIEDMDRGLRDARNSGNPGTTADLTAAAIFVVLLGGGFSDAAE
jgi:triphosphoribosyl-dephospho-CoA synthase